MFSDSSPPAAYLTDETLASLRERDDGRRQPAASGLVITTEFPAFHDGDDGVGGPQSIPMILLIYIPRTNVGADFRPGPR